MIVGIQLTKILKYKKANLGYFSNFLGGLPKKFLLTFLLNQKIYKLP